MLQSNWTRVMVLGAWLLLLIAPAATVTAQDETPEPTITRVFVFASYPVHFYQTAAVEGTGFLPNTRITFEVIFENEDPNNSNGLNGNPGVYTDENGAFSSGSSATSSHWYIFLGCFPNTIRVTATDGTNTAEWYGTVPGCFVPDPDPTPEPTATQAPSPTPTDPATEEPTEVPTEEPTEEPTEDPTTEEPTVTETPSETAPPIATPIVPETPDQSSGHPVPPRPADQSPAQGVTVEQLPATGAHEAHGPFTVTRVLMIVAVAFFSGATMLGVRRRYGAGE
jgi:hypothetical protein